MDVKLIIRLLMICLCAGSFGITIGANDALVTMGVVSTNCTSVKLTCSIWNKSDALIWKMGNSSLEFYNNLQVTSKLFNVTGALCSATLTGRSSNLISSDISCIFSADTPLWTITCKGPSEDTGPESWTGPNCSVSSSTVGTHQPTTLPSPVPTAHTKDTSSQLVLGLVFGFVIVPVIILIFTVGRCCYNRLKPIGQDQADREKSFQQDNKFQSDVSGPIRTSSSSRQQKGSHLTRAGFVNDTSINNEEQSPSVFAGTAGDQGDTEACGDQDNRYCNESQAETGPHRDELVVK